MNKYVFIVLSTLSLVSGFFFFAYLQEWIVLRRQQCSLKTDYQDDSQTIKKKVRLIFWHNSKWNTENEELIWPANNADKLYYLLNSWLALLDQETIMDKKVSLQTAIISANGREAFISFDRNPLSTENSTCQKLMWIESLLKTVRDNDIVLDSVRFLIHHQPLMDDHLDFTNSWPLQGFLER